MPAFWGVVRSLPQREKFAAARVEALGYPVFLPLVPAGKRKGEDEGRPLWAGYFCAQITSSWRPIATCFGVLCILKTGDCPAKLPDREVEVLRSMIDEHGFVRLPEAPSKPSRHVFKKNERVKIIGGPFEGVRAIHAGMRAGDRERVLLSLLGSSARPVMIPSHQVVPA